MKEKTALRHGCSVRCAFDRKVISLAIVAACLLLITACKQSPKQVESPSTMPASFSKSADEVLKERWWEAFNDEALNKTMQMALEGNFSLRASWDRLDRVRAVAKREGAPLWPSVNLSANAQRQFTDVNDRRTSDTSLLVGLAVSYELDLWGRIRNQHQAALLDVKVSEQEIQSAAISISATLSEAWFNLARARATLIVLEEQVEINEKQLELLDTRFQRGQSQAVDVLRQKQLLESTQGLKRESERRAAVYEHQIQILMGKMPKDLQSIGTPRVIGVPPLPITGLPSDLLRRRPDLRAMELQIMAEDRRLASAIAAQYPRISLNADIFKSGVDIENLLDNWVASLAASIAQPLFDGGRLKSDVERQQALRSEWINRYGDLVLNAMKEVEDALISEEKQRAFIASLEKQLKLAKQVIERSEAGYLNGQLDYLNVLTAITSRQSLERQVINAKADLILYRIGLYRSLAGGIEMEKPKQWQLDEAGKPIEGEDDE